MKTIKIEYINGENRRDTMRRIQRILTEEGKALGLNSASYSKDISVLVNELIQSRQDQHITIREGRNAGRFTRRSPAPTIPLAVKSPVKELDKYIQDSIPDAMYGKMLNLTPREVALQESLKTQVGLSSKIRVPHMEPESRLLAANIVGSLPTGGQGIEEAAKKKLSATVKQALGDLGIDAEGENKKRLLERLQAKPFFNDPTLIANFSNMIRAYHDVRENNLHYMQSIMTGMSAVKDAELFTNSMLPTPDNILNGATAYLIYDTKEALNVQDISSYIDEFVRNLLNYKEDRKVLKATEKQQQIGRFLATFDFNRREAAKALENAALKAIKTGGDFIDSYNEAIKTPASGANFDGKELEQIFTRMTTTMKYTERIDPDRNIFEIDDGVLTPIPGTEGKRNNQDILVEYLVKNGLAYPIIPTAKRVDKSLFLLIPIQLPAFEIKPIGWDRRWMIATMKIVDEYWDMIYGKNRQVILSDLLYLISARAKELFNYDIDVVQMTILALLLTDQRTASRRARSILPYTEGGKTPLRSLKTLIRDSTTEEMKRSVGEKPQIANLMLELKKTKLEQSQAEEEIKKNGGEFLNATNILVSILSRMLDDVAQSNFGNEEEKEINGATKKMEDHASDFKGQIEQLSKTLVENVADDSFRFGEPGKTNDVEKYYLQILEAVENYKDLTGVQPVKDEVYDALMIDDNLFGLDFDTVKEIASYKEVDLQDKDKKDKEKDDLLKDLQIKRLGGMRRLLRNPPSGKVGHITAEVVLGVNILKDIMAVGRDLIGGRSKTIEKKVAQCQKLLMEELRKKAEALGGNTLKNIRIEPFTYGQGNSIIVLLGNAEVWNESGGKKKNPPKSNPMEEGRTDSYDSYTLAKSAAVALANKEGETVYLWREGEKVLVSIFFPGHIVPNNVSEINPNPAGVIKNNPSKERKYKGVIIKKVENGWNVEAYDKTLPTLDKARKFISSKVKGSAKPNQRCIRIISGIQCKGTVVKMNKGPHYRCKGCGAKYKAV